MASIRLKRGLRSRLAIFALTITTLSYCFLNLKSEVKADIHRIETASHLSQDIAQALNAAGLKPGDEVAILPVLDEGGYDMAWLKLAGLRLVASIIEPTVYWTEPQAKRKEINAKLKSLKIKAIVFNTANSNPKSAEFWTGLAPENMKASGTPGVFQLLKKPMPNINYFDTGEGWIHIKNTQCYYLPL